MQLSFYLYLLYNYPGIIEKHEQSFKYTSINVASVKGLKGFFRKTNFLRTRQATKTERHNLQVGKHPERTTAS